MSTERKIHSTEAEPLLSVEACSSSISELKSHLSLNL